MSFSPSRALFFAIPVVGTAALVAGSAFTTSACLDDVDAGITPITGVLVRSSLLDTSVGCGTADGQIYVYAVTVTNADGYVVAGSVTPCFADATFANLSPSSDGGLDFTVAVRAYDRSTYDANAGAIDANSANPNVLKTIPATYATTCQATQQSDIEVLAVCGPLLPASPATITIATGSFARADGGAATCGADFDTVAARINGLDAGRAACPAALTAAGPLDAGVAVPIAVALTKAGASVATAACTAPIQPGHTSTATCGALSP